MKATKIAFWVSTGLLSLMMLGSATMYFVKYPDISATFETLGFDSFIVYPLAIAKVLGVVAILTRKVDWLKEWAYAGFFFNFTLAIASHLHAGDDEFSGGVVALLLLVVSYVTQKKAFATRQTF